MKNVLFIAGKDIMLRIKDYKKLIITLLLPILIITPMAVGFKFLFDKGVFIDRFDVIVVNLDTNPLSRLLVQQFTSDKNLKELINVRLVDREEEAIELVRGNSVVAAIIIPKGFIDSVEIGENYSLRLVANSAHPLKSEMIRSLMESYTRNVSAGQSAVNAVWDYYGETSMSNNEKREKIDRVINEITLRAFARNNIISKSTLEGINSISPIQFYLVSLIIIIIMFSTLSWAKGIIEERDSRVIDRLNLSLRGGGTYILGKFIGIFVIGIIQSIAILLMGSYLLLGSFGTDTYKLMMVLSSVVFAVAGLGLFGAFIIKSVALLEQVGNGLIFIMSLIGGGLIPYIYLPSPINLLSKFTINYWGIKGSLAFIGNNSVDGYMAVFVLLAIGLVAIVLSTLLFSRKERWAKI